jgi:nicotinate-nucleotide--dimethylbenzimidazole phosphoribosyltransferase
MDVVRGLPGNALLLGEMGIGNTSVASLLLARLCGVSLADCTGAGTGLDAAGVARKRAVLAQALAANEGAVNPLDAWPRWAASRWPRWWAPCCRPRRSAG